MTNVPIIKPINITDYEFNQSKYEHVPKLPFRSIVVASSTGGKAVLIQTLSYMFIGTASLVYSFLARQFIMTLPSLKSRNTKQII